MQKLYLNKNHFIRITNCDAENKRSEIKSISAEVS